jgi:hypothetical protein
MLPDFRFVIGAILATVVLGVTSFGLLAAVRLTHQGKTGPLEAARNVAFDERASWNQFNDPDSARRFEDLARKTDAALTAAESAAARPANATPPVAANDAAEERAVDRPADMTPPVVAAERRPDGTADATLPDADAADVVAPNYDHDSVAPAANVPVAVAMAPPVSPPLTALPAPAEPTPPASETPPAANTTPADEPAETGALTPAPAAVTTMPARDEEPNLIVEDQAPAAADRVAKSDPMKTDAMTSDAMKTDTEKTEETPTPPRRTPIPAAKPAAKAAPVRRAAVPAKPVEREEREPAPVRTVTAPRPRVVAPRPQYAPQSYGQQQYYEPQPYGQPQQLTRQRSATPQYGPQPYVPQQYGPQPAAPRQRQPNDQYLSPYGSRSQYGG